MFAESATDRIGTAVNLKMTKNNTAKDSVIMTIYENEKPGSPVYSLSLSLSLVIQPKLSTHLKFRLFTLLPTLYHIWQEPVEKVIHRF
jgi:hypothetical protein